VFDFDNRVFRVNGSNMENLKKALELVMSSEYDGQPKQPESVSKNEKGLIFHWHEKGGPPIVPLTLDVVFEMAKAYLSETKPNSVELGEWESNLDHDGHNAPGWIVYTGDWGQLESHSEGFAVKPVYLWYGK